MRKRGALVLVWTILATLFCAPLAAAFDLDETRRQGAVLARALALGADGDWAGAAALVVSEDDAVLADIVLWRKLRAGAGSLPEYQQFVARRATWPGQDALRAAVFGGSGGGGSAGGDGLDGRALNNWTAFRRAYDKRDYDEAARLLEEITVDPRGLGRPALWSDRRVRLARREARLGNAARAYHLASQHHLVPTDGYDYADNEWIAGWVALRKQGDPARAIRHFERFQAAVETPISLARGGYWLGRAHAAAGSKAEAARWYKVAAAHQTAFYGQLAAAEIGAPGDSSLAARDLPNWRTTPAVRSDDVRMATLLHFAGENALAVQSFSHLAARMPGGAAVGALGSLALELGRPHIAVRIAKQAARRGVLILPAYYPLHELAGYASEIEPALAMAIARQETELDQTAVSPAGARGLMQLMPGTASKVARTIGEDYSKDRLIDDWRYNARLGQRYLAEQIRDFGGSYVMAAAAYNAGPNRVTQWAAEFGDPRDPGVDTIDWIESIPFDETRNYVHRVMEAIYVYRTRLSGEAGAMTIRADLARGHGG